MSNANETAGTSQVITLNPKQQEALDAIKKFLESINPIFIIKGSAGTGKTTLVQAICRHLAEKKIKFQLAATTGRAAKVLAAKSGQEAITLHSMLYTFDEVTGRDDSGKDPWTSDTGQLYLTFDIRPALPPDEHPEVFIIDEASMISHLPAESGHTAQFGSGRLLDDLIQFANGSKLIFVGDSCQLPPIAKESLSAALSQKYWKNRGLVAQEAELTDIVRQQRDNEVLQVAQHYRNEIVNPRSEKKLLHFPVPRSKNVFAILGNDNFLRNYADICRQNQIREAVTICAGNQDALAINNFIRKQLHGQHELQTGELLMVVQNSYNVDLANGDQVIVEAVEPHRQQALFTFLKVKVRSLFNDKVYETLLIADLLYNASPGLEPAETKRLMIDFDSRMRHLKVARNSATYKDKMKKDPYLNALRAKFGYAITVHKAQGGEWDRVYLYLTRRLYAQTYGPDGAEKYHRWFYTAVTRARQKLFVNDCPTIFGFQSRHPREYALYWQKMQKEKGAERKAERVSGVITRILHKNDKGMFGFIKPDGARESIAFNLGVQHPLYNFLTSDKRVTFEVMAPITGKGPKAIHMKAEK